MHITIPQMITNDELEKKISMLSLQSVMPTKPKKKKKKKTNLNLSLIQLKRSDQYNTLIFK